MLLELVLSGGRSCGATAACSPCQAARFACHAAAPSPSARRPGRGPGTGGGRGGRSGGGRGGGRGQRPDCQQAPATDRQVSFAGAFPEDPVTAIIGGGLSGLVCAQELARRGLRSVVFDTGEHGVGGRLATRASADGSLRGAPQGLVFDHAAQYFTAADPAFQTMVQRWEADGSVRRWSGPVGVLRSGTFSPDASQVRYVGHGGMRQLATYLAGQASAALRQSGSAGPAAISGLAEVRRPQWVSEARHTPDGWLLTGRGRQQGCFDAVVIAHNGKCANRLAAPMGAPAVHSQLRRLKLAANWVLLAAFAAPVPAPGHMEGAFVQGCPVLSWAANNTAKLGLGGTGGAQCWTLVSSQAYGRANKVPQENVPPEVAQRVAAEMLAAFASSLGLARDGLPPVIFTKAQLWGASLPTNSPRVPCIFDPAARVGVCGDWVAGGGSMEAAALSGAAMAERIASARGRQPADLAPLALGLATPLQPVGGEEIGQFPGAGSGAGSSAAMGTAQEPARAAPTPERPHQRRPGGQPAQRRPQPPTQQQRAAAAAGVELLRPPVRLGAK